MTMAVIKSKASWWPKLIVATFVFFALFIGNMVRQAMKSDVDLVSQDYYKKELAFQKHIDQLSATAHFKKNILINYAAAAEQISLVFPTTKSKEKISGVVHFFRPSDAKLDFEVPLQLNENLQHHLSTKALAKGLWRVKISWNFNNQDYYQQKDIIL